MWLKSYNSSSLKEHKRLGYIATVRNGLYSPCVYEYICEYVYVKYSIIKNFKNLQAS